MNEYTVAEIFGVGTMYRIDAVLDAEFRVTVSSGPATKIVAEHLSWVEAMDCVRDAVAMELFENA